MAEQPHIYVLGGPNGAGKSTVASVLLPESLGVHQFVNADLIAKGLSPFAPESAELAAGRIMIERMYALRSRGQSFGFESTLASKSPVRFLQDAKALGYLVDIAFLWVDSVTLAQARVRGRVAAGGHDIPPEVVERRYWRGRCVDRLRQLGSRIGGCCPGILWHQHYNHGRRSLRPHARSGRCPVTSPTAPNALPPSATVPRRVCAGLWPIDSPGGFPSTSPMARVAFVPRTSHCGLIVEPVKSGRPPRRRVTNRPRLTAARIGRLIYFDAVLWQAAATGLNR